MYTLCPPCWVRSLSFKSTSIAPFFEISVNQNDMSIHLTIKNEKRPNPRTAIPGGGGKLGETICFMFGNKGLGWGEKLSEKKRGL